MLGSGYFNPYLNIVPVNQVKYVNDKESLIAYLKENSKVEIANVEEKKLRPAKLHFTLTKNETIENAIRKK